MTRVAMIIAAAAACIVALTVSAIPESFAQTTLPDQTVCRRAINSKRSGWVEGFYAEEAERRSLTFRACDEMNNPPASIAAAPAHSEHRMTLSESRQQLQQWLNETSLRQLRANRLAQQQRNTPAMSAFGETADQRTPDGARPWIPYRTGYYSNELENEALNMFPSVAQDRERKQWMAYQKQRAIENEINRSKPLLYPVNSR